MDIGDLNRAMNNTNKKSSKTYKEIVKKYQYNIYIYIILLITLIHCFKRNRKQIVHLFSKHEESNLFIEFYMEQISA